MEIYVRPGVRLRLKVPIDAERRGRRDTNVRMRDVESEHACLPHGTAGSSLHAPPMPRLAETEARRPHTLVRQCACQDRLREH